MHLAFLPDCFPSLARRFVLAVAIASTLFLSVADAASSAPAIRVYPTGNAMNTRVPMIPTQPGGFDGSKRFVSQQVTMDYDFGPHLGNTSQGVLDLAITATPRRRVEWPVVLVGKQFALGIKVGRARDGREAQLVWMQTPKENWDINNAEMLANVTTQVIMEPTWRQATLQWNDGKATLRFANNQAYTLDIDSAFRPTHLVCYAADVDELSLKTDAGTLRLDWEQDYAARIKTTGDDGAVTADLLGFDTYVISRDPNSRHFPMLQIANSTAEPQIVDVDFTLKRELADDEQTWQQQVTVPPGQDVQTPIAFPVTLQSDVHHLTAEAKLPDEESYRERRHFLYAPRRDEPAGPMKFGLHDANVKRFGFWPDPLPIRIAHHYLRWGYVQGPGWEKDWGDDSDRYGLNPAIPPEEWNWNARVNWSIAADHIPFVSVHSVPYASWQRIEPYENKMKKYPWGDVGGQPDLDAYRRFLEAVADRYAGKVPMWEVENEPKSHMPRDRYPEYVEVMEAVHDKLKSADPNTRIFGISGTGDFQYFLETVLAHEGGQYMDGVSWHTYTSPKLPDQVDLPGVLAKARNAIKKAAPGKAILNSETGVYVALRYDIDHAIPSEVVAEKIRERNVSFVKNSWMGDAFDEWTGGVSYVTNAVYNFLAGAEAFVFFGWNPDWPQNPKWVGQPTWFSLLTASAEGERGPSLTTLAVATLSTQLEAALLQDRQRIEQAGINGGLFRKANGGSVAVLWSPSGEQTVLLKTQQPQLEVVSMLGQPHNIKVVDGIGSVVVGQQPIYVHSESDLAIQPSPFAQVDVTPTGPDGGKLALTLVNPFSETWDAQIQPADDQAIQLMPAMQSTTIEPNHNKTINFTYKLDTEQFEQAPPLRLETQGPGGVRIVSVTTIPVKPVVQPTVQKTLPDPMTDKAYQHFSLDRLDQVHIGRPPALASLQDPAWWSGPEELSAEVALGLSQQQLVVALDVHNPAARLPQSWPGVKGSVVEMFFDFRQGDSLGQSVYNDGVFQLLLLPQLSKDQSPAIWSPQFGEVTFASVQSNPTKDGYRIVLRMPWDRIPGLNGRIPERFGFDLGINGPPPDTAGRKTQMMLFGDAMNSRDASNFGLVLPKQN